MMDLGRLSYATACRWVFSVEDTSMDTGGLEFSLRERMILRGMPGALAESLDGLCMSDVLRVWAGVPAEVGRVLVLAGAPCDLNMVARSAGLTVRAPELSVVLTADTRPMVLDTSRTEVTLSR